VFCRSRAKNTEMQTVDIFSISLIKIKKHEKYLKRDAFYYREKEELQR